MDKELVVGFWFCLLVFGGWFKLYLLSTSSIFPKNQKLKHTLLHFAFYNTNISLLLVPIVKQSDI